MLKSSILVLFYFLQVACDGHKPSYVGDIPFVGEAMEVLVKDINQDGMQDLLLMSHGYNKAQILYQTKKREFGKVVEVTDVGFHPGLMMDWGTPSKSLLLNGEGTNSLVSYAPDDVLGIKRQAEMILKAPVQSTSFHVEGWEEQSLAISSFRDDKIALFRGLDPQTLSYKTRYEFNASKGEGSSFLAVGHLKSFDADRDGSDEIYYSVGILGQVRRIHFESNGDVPKSSELVAEVSVGIPEVLLTADLNDDGSLDLIVPDLVPGGWLHVLMNDTKGHFSEVEFPNLLPNKELQSFSINKSPDGSHQLLIVGVNEVSLLTFPKTWTTGVPVSILTIPRKYTEAALSSALSDLDGDGVTDALIGLDRATLGLGARVIYGPLTEHFQELVSKKWIFD